MENISTTPTEETRIHENHEIYLDNEAIAHLNETRNWTLFLSILGFIFIGLMLLGSLVASFFASEKDLPGFGGQGLISMIFLIIIILIYFFPIYYLYQFSQFSSRALKEESTALLSTAMKYLKYYYRYIGILIIVVLSFYVIILLFAAVIGANFIPK